MLHRVASSQVRRVLDVRSPTSGDPAAPEATDPGDLWNVQHHWRMLHGPSDRVIPVMVAPFNPRPFAGVPADTGHVDRRRGVLPDGESGLGALVVGEHLPVVIAPRLISRMEPSSRGRVGLPLINGLGIDIWHGAGALACSSKRSGSLLASGRAAHRDWPQAGQI